MSRVGSRFARRHTVNGLRGRALLTAHDAHDLEGRQIVPRKRPADVAARVARKVVASTGAGPNHDRPLEPGETWKWCYVDADIFE